MSLDLFAVASQNPAAVAVVDAGREQTYAELASRSELCARRLAERGVFVPGSPLALVVRPTLPTLVALHACIAYGVPVVLLGARLPAAERAELAVRAGARGPVEPDADDPLATVAAGSAPAGPAQLDARPRIDPDAPLAIVPTSGTTGRAKLVVLSRRAFVASAHASAKNLPLHANDRWLMCLPPSHVGGLSVLTRSLVAGSAVCVFEPSAGGLSRRPGELARALDRSGATLVSLVPALLGALLDLPEWRPPAALRAVLLGGAATSSKLLARATARAVPLLVSYGLTEACSQVTTTRFGTTPRTAGGLVSSGHPLPGVELRVLRDDRICVRAPTLADGLLDEPLPRDPEGFLLTDDLGRLDSNGELFVHGRASERIVSGGENVDPIRVEAVLLREPAVRAACVFGVTDERFGELVACALVVSPDFDPVHCRYRLEHELAPEARPRQVALLGSLPELPNGKLDRAAVRTHAAPALLAWSELRPRAAQTPT